MASAVIGTDAALGILPLGTLNHFAKDLGIPLGLDEAVATIANGERREVDIGEVNGKIFLNNSSLGLYPWFVRQREGLQKRGYSKIVAFFHALIAAIRKHEQLYLRLKIDELRERARETSFVFIGNNKYEIAGSRAGKRATLDSGELWVCRARRSSRMQLFLVGMKALVGIEPHEFDTLDSCEVWIETRAKRLSVATDGEVTVMSAPLHYKSRPRALTVIAPKPVSPAEGN